MNTTQLIERANRNWELRKEKLSDYLSDNKNIESEQLRLLYCDAFFSAYDGLMIETRERDEKIIQSTCDWLQKHDVDVDEYLEYIRDIIYNHIDEIMLKQNLRK